MHVLAADHPPLVELKGELQEVGRDVSGAAAATAAAEAEHKVERRLLLDVVVGQSAAFLQLLPGEDQPLLIRRDPYMTNIYSAQVQQKLRSGRLPDAIIYTGR